MYTKNQSSRTIAIYGVFALGGSTNFCQACMLGGIGTGSKVLAADRLHIQSVHSVLCCCPEGLKSYYYRAYEYLHRFLLKVLT